MLTYYQIILSITPKVCYHLIVCLVHPKVHWTFLLCSFISPTVLSFGKIPLYRAKTEYLSQGKSGHHTNTVSGTTTALTPVL